MTAIAEALIRRILDMPEDRRRMLMEYVTKMEGPASVPPPPPKDAEELARREEEFIRDMRARGLIESFDPPAEPAPADFRPVRVEGEPLSETVIRMRGAE